MPHTTTHAAFKRTMKVVEEHEQIVWDIDNPEHEARLYSSRSKRFSGGPLLYQVNVNRPDRALTDAVFTMHPQDMIHEPTGMYLHSLHKLYMEEADLTEYAVAQRLFGSLKLWRQFIANVAVAPFIEELREELQIKLKSETLSAMRQTMLTEGSKGTSAARYLAEMNKAQEMQDAPGSNTERYTPPHLKSDRGAAGLTEDELAMQAGFEEDLARLNLQ